MKIRINGLFYKDNNDVVIDFNQKNIILIGDNGTGKSTTLKILDSILKRDFIKLTKYPFRSIYFDDIEFNYCDFFPTIDYIVDEVLHHDEKLMDEYNQYIINANENFYSIPKEIHYAFGIHRLIEENPHEGHLYFSLFDKDSYLRTFVFAFYGFDKAVKILEDILVINENINEVKFYNNSRFSKNNNDILENIESLNYSTSFILNMASDYHPINNSKNKFTCSEFESSIYDIKDINEVYPFSRLNNMEKGKEINFVQDYYDKFIQKDITEIINQFKFEINDYEIADNFDIGKYIYSHVYTDEMKKEFIKDYYDFIENHKADLVKYNEIMMEDGKYFEVNPEIYYELFYYIKPLLPKDSIFDYAFCDGYHYMLSNAFPKSFELLLDFYNEYGNKYIRIENEQLEKLNKMFSKYFDNKTVFATPFGIVISSLNGWKYAKWANNIRFDDLSTGEQRLILLLIVSVFSKDMILLLDEPDTSLSIIWQKELLNDLTENCEYSNLIVATQSPYLITDDKIGWMVSIPEEK